MQDKIARGHTGVNELKLVRKLSHDKKRQNYLSWINSWLYDRKDS